VVEMRQRLTDFLNIKKEHEVQVAREACETLFLGMQQKRHELQHHSAEHVALLRRPWHDDVGASIAIPLNMPAEQALWEWWARDSRALVSQRLAVALSKLQDPDDDARGYALQTVMLHSIHARENHKHVLQVHRAFGSTREETLNLECEQHFYDSWQELASGHRAEFPLADRALASFSKRGPDGYDYVFKVATPGQPTLYAFIDATVSPLMGKLPRATSDSRKNVILSAIANWLKLLGLEDDRVVVVGEPGESEIVVLDEDGVARDDVRVVFIVATTHDWAEVRKKNVSWIDPVHDAEQDDGVWMVSRVVAAGGHRRRQRGGGCSVNS